MLDWRKQYFERFKFKKLMQYLQFFYFGLLLRIRNNKKLIITGCGRSGTKFSSTLFRKFGLDIGHETLGRHGISSWFLVPDTIKKSLGPSYNHIKRLKMPIIHQVRYPLNVISSTQTFSKDDWNFVKKFIPINENDEVLVKCMKYWYYWNILAEKKSIYTYRLENIENEVDKIFKIGRFKKPFNKEEVLSTIPKNVNTRRYTNLNWKDLMNHNSKLTDNIIVLAKKYGYDDLI